MSLQTIVTSIALASLLLASTPVSASDQHQGHITPQAASIDLAATETAAPSAQPIPNLTASDLSVSVLGLSLTLSILAGGGAFLLSRRQQLSYETA